MTATMVDEAIARLLASWDSAFAAGDADRFAALFADSGTLLLLHREPLHGPEVIRAWLAESSQRFDASAWEPRTEVAEVDGDHAYVFRTYTERLRNRVDGSRQLVRGRLVYILRRVGGEWRIGLLMNSHSHPMEPLP